MKNLTLGAGANSNHLDNIEAELLMPFRSLKESRCLEERLRSIKESLPEKALPIYPVIQLLVTVIAPSRIYMLQNDVGQDNASSSTELLVVAGGRTDKPFPEVGIALEMANLGGWDVACSLYNEGSVIEGLRKGHIFYSLYFTDERVVYDDGSLIYPITSSDNLTAVKNQSFERFNNQFEKSKDFLQCAITLNERHPSSITLFLLHQAIELIYRGILLSLSGYDRKTHEIRALIKHSRKVARPLEKVFDINKPSELKLLQLLDGAYLACRYEDKYKTDMTDLFSLFEKAMLLQSWSQHLVRQVADFET
jgi:HEPN domain-containing protein